jgi:hypothetical protein
MTSKEGVAKKGAKKKRMTLKNDQLRVLGEVLIQWPA